MASYEGDIAAWFLSLQRAMTEDDGSMSLEHCRSLGDCLAIANEAATQPKFRRAVMAVKDVVALGFPLSRALELFPDIFGATHVAVVRYGELYGEVDLVLDRYLERHK